MNTRYSHTQTGKLLRFAALVPVPFFIGATVLAHNTKVVAAVGLFIVILAIIGLIFTSLTIEIDADALSWWFGLGVWRKRIALEDIVSAVPVRNLGGTASVSTARQGAGFIMSRGSMLSRSVCAMAGDCVWARTSRVS